MKDQELKNKIEELQRKASALENADDKDEAFEVRCEISSLLQQNKSGVEQLNQSVEESIDQDD